MARVQVGYDPRPEGLQTTAAPNIQTEQARFDPRANPAFQLAEALGKAQPVIDQFNQDYERKRLQEQILKIDSYKTQFADSAEGVSAAQVGQRMPETVPVVRARIAEGVGREQGSKLIQPIIDQIMQDDAIRLDTAKRTEFLKAKREELIKGLGGDDFYKSGAIAAMDAEIKSRENSWQTQTAQYHQQVQAKDFSQKVTDAFSTPEPGKALEALDATWKASSSLNNIERNKLVIETATKLAYASDDPTLLDKIPTRFLNTESQAEIRQAKIRIQELRMTNYRNAKLLEADQREQTLRNTKVDIINRVSQNQQIDPAEFRNNPDAFAFAMQMKDAGRIPEATSAANATRIRTAILDGATTQGLDQNKVIDQVLANPNLNPREKQAIIQDVPKLIQGAIFLDSPIVKSYIDTRLEPRLKSLESSTNARIQSIVAGRNLRSEVMASFQTSVRNRFLAEFQEKGQMPSGNAARIIAEEEIDRAEKLLESLTAIRGANQQPPAATPAPAAAPRAAQPAARPQPTQADIDFAKKNPQFRQRFIDTFGREP